MKVAVVGAPGSGKAAIVKAVAQFYAHGAIRAGEMAEGQVLRTEFFWPGSGCEGGRLRVRLVAVSGHPVYNAVSELAMADADGVVFVVPLSRQRASAAKEALHFLGFNARQNGLDLATHPAAMHYHRPSAASGAPMSPEEMDKELGVPRGAVARFVSASGDEELRASTEWVIEEIARRRASSSPSLEAAQTG